MAKYIKYMYLLTRKPVLPFINGYSTFVPNVDIKNELGINSKSLFHVVFHGEFKSVEIFELSILVFAQIAF